MKYKNANSVLTDAIKDITENGFSYERMRYWSFELRKYIKSINDNPDRYISRVLSKKFKSAISRSSLTKAHPGISVFSIDRITPELRVELDRRILSSADLIKIDRDAAIEKTIQRFSGWSTSIPQTGTLVADKVKVKSHIMKPIRQARFEENRVANDQGHKMIDAINEVIGMQTGAIGVIWHSHYRQAGYDYRIDHKERDGVFYVIRDNWAINKGLMKLSGHKYTDEITRPAEEVNCRCYYVYITSLRDIPEECLTSKGKKYLG